MKFKSIFQNLKNEKMQFSFFEKLIFWIILSIHGFISFYVLYLNFSIKTKTKTLFLISYFNLSKNQNGMARISVKESNSFNDQTSKFRK